MSNVLWYVTFGEVLLNVWWILGTSDSLYCAPSSTFNVLRFMEYRYTAIVLGKYDVGETDRIYTLFTREEGKVKVKGVGVRKPNAKLAGHLETGMFSAVTVMKRRGMGRVAGAICERSHIHAESSLGRARYILEALSCVNRLVEEGERDESLFGMVMEYLGTADVLEKAEKEDRMEVVSLGFWFHVIRHMGAAPNMNACSLCGNRLKKMPKYSLSVEYGGVVCEQCKDVRKYAAILSLQAANILRVFSTNRISSLKKLSVDTTHSREVRNALTLFENHLTH